MKKLTKKQMSVEHIEAVYKTLPDFCFFKQDGVSNAGKIEKGDKQFTPMNLTREQADNLNFQLGVTREVEQAMLTGSMFGWHVPGIDPQIYSE